MKSLYIRVCYYSRCVPITAPFSHNQAKEQISERSKNISKESSLASLLEAKQQDQNLLNAQDKKLDAEMATLSGQIDSFLRELAEAESLIMKSVAINTEKEQVENEILELTSNKQTISQKAKALKKDLEAAISSLEEASNLAKELELEKLENDKEQVQILEPAMIRKAEAMKEKEKLAGEVANLHKNIIEMEDTRRDTMSHVENKLASLNGERKEAKEKLERATLHLQELEKNAAEEEATRSKELQEYKDFTSKFEEATKAEISRLEEMKRQRIDVRIETLEKRRMEIALVEDERNLEKEYLKRGLSMVEEMKGLEAVICQSEIILAENGDELSDVPWLVEKDSSVPDILQADEGNPTVGFSGTDNEPQDIEDVGGNHEDDDDYDDSALVRDRDDMITEAASPVMKRRRSMR